MTASAQTHPAQPITLYRHALSGHCHRVQLLLSLLGLPHEIVEVDLASGAHKQPDFLDRHPFGKVPVIQDGDVTLWDSNAILVYLATRYDADRRWLPIDAVRAALVQGWLSIAAGEIAGGPAAARLVTVFGAGLDHDAAKATAGKLFDVLERWVADRPFLAGADPTIADVAAYAYIAHAPEGGVALSDRPQIQAWLGRIEQLPGFVPMQRTTVAPAA